MLGFCYLNVISLGETARRIRIIRELYNSRDGLSLEEILQRYNSQEILERRINRLMDSGQITHQNGRYYIGKQFVLIVAKLLVIMKQIVLGKKSEFD
jgi:predicted transcriptional regulator